MTNLIEINEGLAQVVEAMLEKGFVQPEADLTLRGNADGFVILKWRIVTGKETWDYTLDTHVIHLGSDSSHDWGTSYGSWLSASLEWVAIQPSKAERERKEFMESVGAVIESGKRIGIEVEYTNPLVELMKKLSKNALRGPKEAGR